MKKRFFLLLCLMLLLTGCANAQPEEVTQMTTEETKPQGYYMPESILESQTKGAVRVYELPEETYTDLCGVGDQLIAIAAGAENVTLTVLTGEEGVPTATAEVPTSGGPLYNGYGYFDETQKQVVFLDAQLKQTNLLQLPEDIQGRPVISPDAGEVFYCVGENIYGIDVERKISRLIKTHTYPQQSLIDSYFEGKLISCQAEQDKILYISTETGQTVYESGEVLELATYENEYLAKRKEGRLLVYITGLMSGNAKAIDVPDASVTEALALDGIVGWSVDENKGLTLNFYRISSGKKTASVVLPGVGEPLAVCPDRWGSYIWVLCQGGKTLLRWSMKETPVTEQTSYIGQLSTAQAPDEAQLALCQERADAFYESTGVYLRVWQDAVQNTGGYTLVAEYQPENLNIMMDELLPVLQEFPKNFLKECATGKIRIGLVRSVDGGQRAVQFWEKKRAHIVLPSGADDLRSEFIRCLGYLVDSHVLGNSPDYDYWSKQNPEDFVYGDGGQKPEYLTGDTRYFVSENAMRSPVEDRSELFYHAMQPDNAEMFQSQHMQKKLTALCKAIRDAWDTKKETEVFPWEQYLKEPVAYQQ